MRLSFLMRTVEGSVVAGLFVSTCQLCRLTCIYLNIGVARHGPLMGPHTSHELLNEKEEI